MIIAYLIAAAVILIGLGATILPAQASKFFGIELKEEPAISYVRTTGARDIFIGVALLLCCWRGEADLIGYVCLAIAIVSVTDFYVTLKHGSHFFALVHLAGTVAVIAYGTYLIVGV